MPAQRLREIERLMRAGRGAEALGAARQLTVTEPGNPSGWLALGGVLLALGRPVQAVDALRTVHGLAPDDAAVAERFYAALVQAGLRLEAVSQSEGAEAMYREAVGLHPESIPARLNLGRLLGVAGRYEASRAELGAVLERIPGQPDATALLALSHEYEGDYATALAILRGPLAERPVAPAVALAYAALARHVGEESAAATLLESLANAPLADALRTDIQFALGRLQDALGRYEQAFAAYRRGNELLGYRYDPAQTRAEFRAIADAFSAARHPRFPRSTLRSELPVFIVGMPRSGTSLVEQILASHPAVHGAGELDDIARLVHGFGGPAAAKLPGLTGAELDRAGQAYLERIARLAPGALRVTDKMPHNFLALGFIDLLFPGCRIVHCVRDPRDTCLSIWFQRMTGNHPYTSDLGALADYYRLYRDLMAHWKSVVRVPILDVQYEALVRDIEPGARELVAFCGLDWSDTCLAFHANARVVSTPTYDQVRQPVHDRSVGRWRHYRRHLDALAGLADGED